jgi:aspartate/methionine/tyrosine aminotransferase
MAFLVLLMTLCPPSASSVLLPMPSYFNNLMAMSLQSVKPIYIPSEPSDAFKPSLSAARTHLAEHALNPTATPPKAIVLVTPNNPTGTVYSPEDLKEWFDLAKQYKVALVLDETYRDFVEGPDGKRGVPHNLYKEKDWRGTLVCLGGFSSTLSNERFRVYVTADKSQRVTGYQAIV